MFTRKFKKFLRREGKNFKRRHSSGKKIFKHNSDNKKPKRLVCYNYRKYGHIQTDCPKMLKLKQIKGKTTKPRAMICTLSEEEEEDEGETSSDDEDKRKLCLMANDGEENDQVSSSFENYTLSDWEDAYAELVDKFDNLRRDNRHLKKRLNLIVHDNTLNDKVAYLEADLTELT